MRKSVSVAAAAIMLGLAATSSPASAGPASTATAAAAAATPQLVGVPSVRYSFVRDGGGRYVSLGAVFRTDRALDRTEYATIAAPTLRTGQALPGRLFGGTTPSRIGTAGGHCYSAEVSQIRRRATLSDRTWKLGLRRDGVVVGRVKSVTLKRADGDVGWQQRAARRLGC